MITSINKHLYDLIEKEIKNNNSIWKEESLFKKIKYLSIDQRGRLGEHFIVDIFKELNKEVEYINNGHDDFDLIVDNIKIEVKLSTLDVNSKFQHEGVKSNKIWDIVAFIDISPNDIYVTFIHKDDFTFDLERENKKGIMSNYGTVILNCNNVNMHCRGKDIGNERATGAGYKVDFKLNQLIKTNTKKWISSISNKK